MRKYYESREDHSGKLFEHFLFGDVTSGKNNARYMSALRKAIARSGNIKDPRQMPIEIALDLVREIQVQDPTNPTRPFMKDLRTEVVNKLHLTPANSKRLAIYSAVGTPLDQSRNTQTDAFFEWQSDNGELIRVTLDATLNAEKIAEKNHNSDIFISDLPDKIENEKNYMAAVGEIADQIAKILKKRIDSQKSQSLH